MTPNAPLSRAPEADPGDAGSPAKDAGKPAATDSSAADANAADPADGSIADADQGPIDAGFEDSGACDQFVTMHDTYAQALYLDGTLGPLTGIIYVDYVLRNEPIELDFWHGHGNLLHKFTLLPEHFDRLKQGERVTITTTEVDSHEHELFIDPLDPTYEVPGSQPVQVPLC
jgi:hypothetical protein